MSVNTNTIITDIIKVHWQLDLPLNPAIISHLKNKALLFKKLKDKNIKDENFEKLKDAAMSEIKSSGSNATIINLKKLNKCLEQDKLILEKEKLEEKLNKEKEIEDEIIKLTKNKLVEASEEFKKIEKELKSLNSMFKK
jgi:hypothetical protein